jgi:23S rRNA (cytidine1920-2'-O)/16S rRNA (cytidine1409-2'-O)-methyltransferase
MNKKRIDILMVERGVAESRSLAQRLIMAGEVLADGQLVFKASQTFPEDVQIKIKRKPRFVSRGGYKLERALIEFGFYDLTGKICVDVGASTGGFTDCLLQHGAERVYAVDVGYGQLHDSLRNSQKVVVMERTNVKNVEGFPEPIDLVVIDASFISLKIILPIIKKWDVENNLNLIALIKPQFEAGRKEAARGKGVIRSEKIRLRVIGEVIEFAQALGFIYHQTIESPIEGPKGNKEFLVYLEIKQ